jgi:YgiT-type zinc finger domain-containing protein
MQPHTITEELRNPDGTITYIPDLEVEICNVCGEQVYEVKAIRAIEAHKKSLATVNLCLPFLVYRHLEVQAHEHGHSIEDEISNVLISDYRHRAGSSSVSQ